nr:hypothetical protein [uncultured Cetobacterium sp.]
MVEKDLLEIIKKEVEKYLKNTDVEKSTVKLIGNDELLKNEIEKKFDLCKNSKKIVITDLKIPELISLDIGTYTDEVSKEILNHILEGDKIFIIKEGIEWRKFKNIPEKLYKKYEASEKSLMEYGVKFINKIEILENLEENSEINYFSQKVLNLRNIKKISGKKIIISEKTIITQLAMDYIRENDIKVIKRG